MATPDVSADLFCTILDPSGMKTVHFASDAGRDEAFGNGSMGVVVYNDLTDYDYVRKDNVLKVPYNADILDNTGINYCRYKDPQFADRYIYAFVDRIEYLAPETSALHLRTDSFMTYQNKILTTPVFVKRRTVTAAEDTIGTNLLDEPVGGTHYFETLQASYLIDSQSFFNNYGLGIITETFTQDNSNDTPDSGDWFDVNSGLLKDPNYDLKRYLDTHCAKVVNGVPIVGNIFMATTLSSIEPLCTLFSALGARIVATFYFFKDDNEDLQYVIEPNNPQPFYLLSGNQRVGFSIYGVQTLSSQGQYKTTSKEIALTGTITEGAPLTAMYTPINNKCYQYPYDYLIGTDYNGAEVTYQYELFGTVSTDPNDLFRFYFVNGMANAIVSYPLCYPKSADANIGFRKAIVVQSFPQIPVNNDTFAYYCGTNAAQTQFNRISHDMDIARVGYNGLKGVVSNVLGTARDLQTQGLDTKSVAKNAQHTIGNYAKTSESTLSGALGWAMQGLQTKAQTLDGLASMGHDSQVPASTPILMAIGRFGVGYVQRYLMDDDMRAVDTFFSMYGYHWDRLENLTLGRCPDYDFIQTDGCNVQGSIPKADKQKINALFDAGLTIWNKTARYGQYADSSNNNK